MKTQTPKTFGEVVQAAFAAAARKTRSPRAQAKIATQMIARLLKGSPQPRLIAMLANG